MTIRDTALPWLHAGQTSMAAVSIASIATIATHRG